MVTDPLADPTKAEREYGIKLVPREAFVGLDGLILAVPHRVLGEAGCSSLFDSLKPGGRLRRYQIGSGPRHRSIKSPLLAPLTDEADQSTVRESYFDYCAEHQLAEAAHRNLRIHR
jgi:hypothetical protein